MWINKENELSMKKNFVAESIEEAWVSTDTGSNLYADDAFNKSKENPVEKPNLDSIIPSPTIKLDPEDFEMFVDQLIEVIPENLPIAVELFKKTIQQHPYLMRKTIGFKGDNPYEDIIHKFIDIANR